MVVHDEQGEVLGRLWWLHMLVIDHRQRVLCEHLLRNHVDLRTLLLPAQLRQCLLRLELIHVAQLGLSLDLTLVCRKHLLEDSQVPTQK